LTRTRQDLAELLAALGIVAHELEWQDDALCLEHQAVSFFPERGEPAARAKAVCARCLVRVDCLKYALELQVEHGIWGGLSPQERAQAQRQGLTATEALAAAPGQLRRPARPKPQRARCTTCDGVLPIGRTKSECASCEAQEAA
jgi:WhiB family redox-sensing transcriptional regulator